jgi:Tfp pilus assembly protein PilF
MLSWLGRLLRGTPPAPAPGAEELVREALRQRDGGRLDQAERLLYRALAAAPGAAEIHLMLGDLFRVQGRFEAALQSCQAAVELAPSLATARNNLGTAYRELDDFGRAMAEYRRALELDGSLPEAHFNLAVCLQREGDAAAAAEGYREALRLKPDFALAHLNLGFVLEESGDPAGALDAYAAAVAADPLLVEAHVNHGMQLLLAGRFAEGWAEFEWRLRYPEYSGADAAAKAPRWDGAPLDGRTILLDAEQGFGDALQFLRYAPVAAARGGRVIVRCAPELGALVAGAEGVSAVVRRGEPLPAFDCYSPLPSMPAVLGTTLETIPGAVPYVRADAGKAAQWKAKLGSSGPERKVGLVWASQSGHRTAPDKSLPLEALAPLAAVPGVRFYSLQKGDAARQLRRPPPGMAITDLAGELHDFSDTAAAVAGLDLVISVDTAVAHLAGALGRPTWTLLKQVPDWRWLLERSDSPWYPTMRLFRQARPGSWQEPAAALAEALRQFVAKAG